MSLCIHVVEMSGVDDSGVVSSDEEAGYISTPKQVLVILAQQINVCINKAFESFVTIFIQ